MRTSTSLLALAVALFGLLAPFSPDPLLTLATGATLVLGVALLWPPNETPVLLLPFGLQWLSVAVKPIEAAVTGVPLDDLAERGADLTPAAWFGLMGITALAIGMRLGANGRHADRAQAMLQDAARWPKQLILSAALIAILGGHFLEVASGYAGSARQAIVMLSNIKLAGIYLLTYWCLARREATGLLGTVIAFEVLFGMTGFFSTFKGTVFMVILAALSARPRLTLPTLAFGAALGIMAFAIVVFWSVIKPEYREFLNQGAQAQIVVVPMDQRVGYLIEAASTMDTARFDDGLEIMMARLSYIDFLAHAMAYIPVNHAHTDGAQLTGAIGHILMPRILFPWKEPLPNDTVLTAELTGLTFNDMTYASISLGYLGELWADFGYGGLVVVLLIGVAFGRGYRTIINYRRTSPMANAAVAAMAIEPLVWFERALLKLVGASLTSFLAALVIQRIVIPRALAILDRRSARRRGRTEPLTASRPTAVQRPPAPR